MKSIVEMKITLDNKVYYYLIERKKIKNIYFRIKPDLKIHVSANRLVSNSYIEKLLLENKDSIHKMYEAMTKKISTNALMYLGDKLTFIKTNELCYIENNYIYGVNEEACQKYIYFKASDIFESRLKQLKNMFPDLPDFTLKIRKMTTRWGVCNKKSMSVTLNSELITKNVNLIDYVIVHELCHFKYMNHSKEYWNYVEQFYPYYKLARKELRY